MEVAVLFRCGLFDEHPEVDSIVLVTKEEFVEHCQKELAERYQFAKVRDICIGGKERYDSVLSGIICDWSRGRKRYCADP